MSDPQVIVDLTLQGLRAETMDLARLIRDPATRALVEAIVPQLMVISTELQNVVAHLREEARRAA